MPSSPSPLLALAAAILAFAIPSPLRAQRREAAPGAAPAAAAAALEDTAAVGRFVDEYFGEKLEEWKVPGAAFVLVHEGRVAVSRGYGWADLERRIPVDPDSTRFYLASISKSVTATAAMQLVERGKLDLDADVNGYLRGFHVDAGPGRAVTLRHLLTHTAGFDQRGIGIATHDPAAVEPLAAHLARRLPPVVRPPGAQFAYSNYGSALAGLLVERASGVPFAEYVRREITGPLGMAHSGFDIPHDDPRLARSYVFTKGTQRAVPTAYFHIAPAISFVSTAADMAKLLAAWLDSGAYDGRRILERETMGRMLTPQGVFPDSRLTDEGLGFAMMPELGLRVFEHPGLINGHTSLVVLVPELRAGFFVACNSTRCAALTPLVRTMLARFFGGRPGPPPQAVLTSDVARPEPGVYVPEQHAVRSIEKLRELFDEHRVTAVGDTVVLVLPAMYRTRAEFVPVSSGAFARVDGDGFLLSRLDPAGGRILAHMRGMAREPLRRLRFYETSRFQWRATLALATMLLAGVLATPALWILRERQGRAYPRGLARIAPVQAVGAAACLLGFAGVLGSVLGGPVGSIFIYGVPTPMRLALWLPIVGAALAAPLPVYAAVAWRRRLWPAPERAGFALLVLALAAAFLMLAHWNLIGFNF